MERRAWSWSVGTLATCIVTASFLAAAPPSQGDGEPEDPGGSVSCNDVEEMPVVPTGELVNDHVIGAQVPTRGTEVFAEVVLPTGTQTLEVTHHDDGSVDVSSCGPEPEFGIGYFDESDDSSGADPEAPKAGSPGPCSDNTYDLDTAKWEQDYKWSFNADDTPIGPNNPDPPAAQEGIQEGIGSITNARNSCGLGDNVHATQTYLARTDRHSDIKDGNNANIDCPVDSSTDGANVIDWGPLYGAIRAATCKWQDPDPGRNTLKEADVRIASDVNWVVAPGPGCNNRFSLHAFMAHEAGHIFGMKHVAEASHGNLTMSKVLNGPCQQSEYTLGLGDVRGAEQLYGP